MSTTTLHPMHPLAQAAAKPSAGGAGALGSTGAAIGQDKDERHLGTCPNPSAVEWRSIPVGAGTATSVGADSARTGQRAAVCLLGVARFIDKTVTLLRRNLLQRLGLAYDIFAFVSMGQRPSTCELFFERSSSSSSSVASEIRRLFVENNADGRVIMDDRPSVIASVLSEELEALAAFLDSSCTGRVVWDDRPEDLLNTTSAWRKMVRRPGAWLGGVSNAKRQRPGAGLAQHRALQWCADAVRWQEDHVLRYQYSYVLFCRWDLQWLLPFPGLPLLQSIDEDAVWTPISLDDFFANDRFAVVPRRYLSAYFEGWKLLVSGEVDRLFETVLPRSGLPVYHAENTNCEAFLFARLKYAGAHIAGLPAMAYVHCNPQMHLSSLRTKGFYSCTSFSDLIADGEGRMAVYGGSKYPREFFDILTTDNVLQGVYVDGPIEPGDDKMTAAEWSARFGRLFSTEMVTDWTERAFLQAQFVASQFEVDRVLKEGWYCQAPNSTQFQVYRCSNLLKRVLGLAQTRAEYYEDAAHLARMLVLVEPLNLEHWIMLVVVLMHPILDMQHAALAAAHEAAVLNASHAAIVGTRQLLAKVRLRKSSLEDAMGGANRTWQLKVARHSAKHKLRVRRALQKACASYSPDTPVGFDAWLTFGRHLLNSQWLFAAVGVLVRLEEEYLTDGRPEALRARAHEVAKVITFRDDVVEVIDVGVGWGIYGSTLDDFRRHAPTAEELTSEAWLEKYEARVSDGGRDFQARSVHNVAFHYNPYWKMMLPTGVI